MEDFIVRPIAGSDAEEFLDLRSSTDRETTYLLREPGDDPISAETMRNRIAAMAGVQDQAIFVCAHHNRLIGYLQARGGASIRERGVVRFALAVRMAYWRRGVGTQLVRAFEPWSEQVGAHRLELTISSDNTASQALFARLGYVVEGTRRRAAKVNGVFVDKVGLAKLL
jgi:RimJ/RimL family protein N-acetyltransferase